MNLALTVLGIAARLARPRIERTRSAAIQDALSKLAAGASAQSASDTASASTTDSNITSPPRGS